MSNRKRHNSGRLKPEDAQIGIVWHADYVDEIIDGAKRDA